MTATPPMYDLQNAIDLLQRASILARRLDAAQVPEGNARSVLKGDSTVAALNREIQFLMHLCERAQTEVAAVYWATRGFPDPLGEK